MFKTRVTDLFGIKYPIIQGALGGGLATPELVAAVSNAGGKDKSKIDEALKKVRSLI